MLRRGRVVKAFAAHFSCTRAQSPGSNPTTVIGPAMARTRMNQPATFSGTANRILASAGVHGGNVASVRWQVKLCSGETNRELLYAL